MALTLDSVVAGGGLVRGCPRLSLAYGPFWMRTKSDYAFAIWVAWDLGLVIATCC